MTRNQAKRMLETVHEHRSIMEAYANGKVIETKPPGHNKWVEITTPTFWPHYEYRIKPEPQEVFVVRSQKDHTQVWAYRLTRENAEQWLKYANEDGPQAPYEIVKFVEEKKAS